MGDKKLWEEIENCLEYDYSIYGSNSEFLHTTSIENLMNWFKDNEINILKDFVEWYKTKIINDRIKTAKEQEEYCYEMGEPFKAIFWENEKKLLQRIAYCLNDDLEKFLKEKNNE